MLRKLNIASSGFIESLRNAPIAVANNPVELPLPEESGDLF